MLSELVKTLKATLAVIAIAAILSVAIYAAVAAIGSPAVTLPERVSADSLCPVAGCASSTGCHGADPAPELASGETMICPKVGCEAEECHAADRLVSHYNEPKTSSLNLWILGLSIFTIAMIAISLYIK